MKKTMITKKMIAWHLMTVNKEHVEKYNKDMTIDLEGFADYFYCYFYKNKALDFIKIKEEIKKVCDLNNLKLS